MMDRGFEFLFINVIAGFVSVLIDLDGYLS